ncbi:MAG: 5'/3'-nucleotidase SurE [Hyphomicrobiaceae bacterium]
MRILVTNDDGIDAPGIHALTRIAEELAGPDGEVWVCAPETNQSGAGHSLSLNEPLRMRKLSNRVYAIRGTPTDSVIMGARHLLKHQKPDLVLSGINRGANMAEDVTYSGTIAGALEGTQLGIPSIALSQAYSYGADDFPHWETAITHGPRLIRSLLAKPWPPLVLMNINFPDRTPDDVEGVMVTSQGRRDQQNLGVEERRDTWGNPYYWLGYTIRRSNPAKGTDLWAVYNGYISVTPLSMNLTDRDMMADIEQRL